MMKTTVVCGLLGSGKTTFIQNLLKQRASAGPFLKTVVLVNDFAQTGIDGEIISLDGVETIELPNGCVCCALKFDLISTIQRVLAKFDPGHLIIEPSGVASVSGILEALDLVKVHPILVVGIIDASEFTELYGSGMYGSFFQDQVQNSDIILINKTDCAPPESIETTVAVVERLNPGSLIYKTVRAGFAWSFPDNTPSRRIAGAVPAGTPHHLEFDTLSVTLKDGIDASRVQDIFEALGRGEYGEAVRAKALVQTGAGPMKFDLVYGKVDTEPFMSPVGRSRLVVIGRDLKRDLLLKAVDRDAMRLRAF